MTQRCGHDEASIKEATGYDGTYCCECLPDGTTDTYVRMNVHPYAAANNVYVTCSLINWQGQVNKIATTPFKTLEEARELADELGAEVWIISPEGEIAYHRESTRA